MGGMWGGELLLWPFDVAFRFALLEWPSAMALWLPFYYGLLMLPSGVALVYGLLVWLLSGLLLWPSGVAF